MAQEAAHHILKINVPVAVLVVFHARWNILRRGHILDLFRIEVIIVLEVKAARECFGTGTDAAEVQIRSEDLETDGVEFTAGPVALNANFNTFSEGLGSVTMAVLDQRRL